MSGTVWDTCKRMTVSRWKALLTDGYSFEIGKYLSVKPIHHSITLKCKERKKKSLKKEKERKLEK